MDATTAIYFVVERAPGGRESPALYHDELPPKYTGKRAHENGFVWGYRLDNNEIGRHWAKKPLAEIYARYCQARDRGELPASNLADRKVAA